MVVIISDVPWQAVSKQNKRAGRVEMGTYESAKKKERRGPRGKGEYLYPEQPAGKITQLAGSHS